MSWSFRRGASFEPPPRPSPRSRHRGILPPVFPRRTRTDRRSMLQAAEPRFWYTRIMVKWWLPVARLVPLVENDDDTGGHKNITWCTTGPEHAQQRRRCPRL
ncbi:unnamed protein product [Ectocarpus sp. 8 AP-2014]